MFLHNQYPIITDPRYKGSLSPFVESLPAAHSALFSINDISFAEGVLSINGIPRSNSEILNNKKEVPKDLDIPFLRLFYTIALNYYESFLDNKNEIDFNRFLKVSIGDLVEYMGGDRNHISENQKISIIKRIYQFSDIVGILDNGIILPVMVYSGMDDAKSELNFAVPYLTRLVERIYKSSFKTDKNGRQITSKNGKPLKVPTHSYLIKPSILKCKNKKSIEIVVKIIELIEQTGSKGTPHIRASKLVESVPLLYDCLCNQKPKKRNETLNRAFTTAWTLLRTETKLSEVYKNIELPDPTDKKNIPTYKQLEKTVFSFKHSGKS